MTTTPEQAGDEVLAGRARSAGEYLAGLIAHGMLETVARPGLLARDLWPDVLPEVAEEIFQRGVAVGLCAQRVAADPERHRDRMDRVQDELEAIGYASMSRMVGRSRRLGAPAVPSHPADGEAGYGH